MGRVPDLVLPELRYDGDFFRAYAAAHADPAQAQAFVDERVLGPETHAAFLDATAARDAARDPRRTT